MRYFVLGSALWGWTVTEAQARALLDRFCERGHALVDAATNYPISGRRDDWRKAETWLTRWVAGRGGAALRIILKIGSVGNARLPDNDLSPERVTALHQEAHAMFGESLHCLMVHWDDREDAGAIGATCDALRAVHGKGVGIGLSGIRRPELYAAAAPDLRDDWLIEIKHNPFQSSDYHRYAPFHGRERFLAYGIGGGGARLDGNYAKDSSFRLRQRADIDLGIARSLLEAWPAADPLRPRSLYELGLAHAAALPDGRGVIVGPRSLEQLDTAAAYWLKLADADLRRLADRFRQPVAPRPARAHGSAGAAGES